MKNQKATYIKRVVEMFAKGRYSQTTEACVARWLTNGNDSQAKEKSLDDLWAESLCEEDGETAPQISYRQWLRQNAGAQHPDADAKILRRTARHLRIWQSAAACLLAAIGVMGTLMLTQRPARATMVQTYCAAGDTREIILPDGTEVLLNGSTTIVYPERFDSRDREVVLIGEANFKVAKDEAHPFIVKSDGVNVTALGTEFNVKAYPGNSTVESTLLEGKVKVNYGKDRAGELILAPSEQLIYDRTTNTASILRPHLNNVTAWQRGEMIFDNATLAEILCELETRFPRDFIYNASSLPTDRYSFRFRKGMPIEEVMGIVSDVVGDLNVNITDTTCRVQCHRS